MVRILIVDDHPLFRRGLREAIEERPGFTIVGEASNGREALRMVAELRPDVAIIDIDMPDLNGLQTARALRAMGAPVAIVFLTMYKERDMFNAAMDLGARAYVLKESAVDDIITALEKVARGETFVSPAIAGMRQQRGDRAPGSTPATPWLNELTPAERRILRLIADDHTSKEIADLLGISVKTVENHRLNICRKLNLHGSHSLLKFAFENRQHL